MARTYELKKRAERMQETRRRIVDAAVELHTTLGPAQTSLAAVAERAGVQRHTLYAHFPDRRALFQACSADWTARHPAPAPEPGAGLAEALTALYAWYECVEHDLALFHRDRQVDALVDEILDEGDRDLLRLQDSLARGAGRRRRAAIGHALRFETWRSLVRGEGLSRAEAVRAMVRFAGSV
jgi:AcrR family transcriptional regulator